jgi:hypothetical protein
MKPFGVFSGIIIVSVRMLLVDATVFAGWDAVQIEKSTNFTNISFSSEGGLYGLHINH